MAKITRRDDAESIIGQDEADELERKARMVGKSDTEDDDLHPAMVVRGDMGRGGYMAEMRRKKKMKMAEVAKRMKITEARLKRLEDEEDDMDDDAMATMADALEMDDDEKEDMFTRFKKKKADVEEDEGKPSKEEMLARFGDKRRKTPPKGKAALEEEAPVEKMGGYDDDDDHDMSMMAPAPFGGAMSIKEAEDYIGAQEKMARMYSFWDMLQGAFYNIKSDAEMASTDKVKATSNLFREMAQKVDTLKAGLSDAFLIQESAAAYDDYGDDDYQADDEYYTEDEVDIMSDEILTPAETLQAAVDKALQDTSLGRDGQTKAVNEALVAYTETIKAQLDEANPAPLGDTIAQSVKAALGDVLAPIADKLAMLDAKVQQQERPQVNLHEVYVPQQKSMLPTQPVQPVAPTDGGLPVSPVIGKPSALTASIRKSVGLHS